jgi:nitroimidazol reductase NimA-like FMN-containing flavoprotein (pyridoxamine 5'-phosphate oxidase superfamily)
LEYEPTRATTPSRHADRASYDADTVHEILDEALLCHVGFVSEGRPQVLPMLFVRVGSTVFLHSSTGAQMARKAAREDGIALALEATVVDALVLARSAFNHSANYRSVVAHGTAALVRDAEVKAEVLEALMEKIAPGRSGSVRPPSEAELRQTAVLALPLVEVSAKIRSGPPADEPEDLSLGHWAGLWPLRLVRGRPEAAPDLKAGIELPAHLRPADGAAPGI